MEEEKNNKNVKSTKKVKGTKKTKTMQNKAKVENIKENNNNVDNNSVNKDTNYFTIKGILYEIIDFNNSAEFVFKVNKAISILILCIVAICLLIAVVIKLFSDILLAVLILLLSPIVLLLTKYILSVYLLLLDWLSASTKFYKSNIKKD